MDRNFSGGLGFREFDRPVCGTESDGTYIWVWGGFNDPTSGIARLNMNGFPTPGWNPPFFSDSVRAIDLNYSRDGILVCGNFYSSPRKHLALLNRDGTDSGTNFHFPPLNVGVNAFFYTLLRSRKHSSHYRPSFYVGWGDDCKVSLYRWFCKYTFVRLYYFDPDKSHWPYDRSYSERHPQTNGRVYTIKYVHGDKLLIGGSFTEAGGWPSDYELHGLLLVQEDGARVPYDFHLPPFNGVVNDTAEVDGGKLLIAGSFTNEGNRLVRLHPTGYVDAGFAVPRQSEGGFNGEIWSIHSEPLYNRVVAVGEFTQPGVGIARILL